MVWNPDLLVACVFVVSLACCHRFMHAVHWPIGLCAFMNQLNSWLDEINATQYLYLMLYVVVLVCCIAYTNVKLIVNDNDSCWLSVALTVSDALKSFWEKLQNGTVLVRFLCVSSSPYLPMFGAPVIRYWAGFSLRFIFSTQCLLVVNGRVICLGHNSLTVADRRLDVIFASLIDYYWDFFDSVIDVSFNCSSNTMTYISLLDAKSIQSESCWVGPDARPLVELPQTTAVMFARMLQPGRPLTSLVVCV